MSRLAEFAKIAHTHFIVVSLSAPRGGEGRGEVGGAPGHHRCGVAHLTLPIANATGPLPLPPEGGEGKALQQLDGPSR